MFDTLKEALEVLEARKNRRLGIDGLLNALPEYNNPQNALSCIHIGGTNGKGSTTDFTRSILENAGYRVGSFTSPHLIAHNDRIRINNEPIADDVLLQYINDTHAVWEKHGLSMFEIDMLISLIYYRDQKVDVCIYEVGLGGRLDATNVIIPKVSAITHVDFDHMDILGDTLEKIAFEKAGIIKQGVPMLTTEKQKSAQDVIKEVARQRQAPYLQINIPDYKVDQKSVTFKVFDTEISLVNQPIYQVENATLAAYIVKQYDPQISSDTIKSGLELTHWAGRFEEIRESVYLDGAHNMNGVTKLIESLQLLPKPWTILFTALKDKEYKTMVSMLEAQADTLIITEFNFSRAESAENLAMGHDAIVIKDKYEAIDYGLNHRNGGTFIITGSLYFISEAREYLSQQ